MTALSHGEAWEFYFKPTPMKFLNMVSRCRKTTFWQSSSFMYHTSINSWNEENRSQTTAHMGETKPLLGNVIRKERFSHCRFSYSHSKTLIRCFTLIRDRRSTPGQVASSSQGPMWAFVGLVPCSRVLWQCSQGVVAPCPTTRTPVFSALGLEPRTSCLSAKSPNRLSSHQPTFDLFWGWMFTCEALHWGIAYLYLFWFQVNCTFKSGLVNPVRLRWVGNKSVHKAITNLTGRFEDHSEVYL